MKFIHTLILAALLLFQSCSCGSNDKSALRIGIDPNWYPINFGPQESYVNGYVEDLLLEIASYSGIQFERIPANWDSLLDGIREKKYDAVISALPPYEFNKAKYEFSDNILDLGPVLIVPVNAQHTDLSKMGGELVGLVNGDPAVLLVQKYGDIVIRNYDSIPELLDALSIGEIEAALLNRVPAVTYISDLYADRLKVASAPLNDAGLHLVAAKGRNPHLVSLFNKSIERLHKKKKMDALLKKWQLTP
ncbi:MAG TPA: transporter substrate-binding domain-containing protein [Chlamydiales bacterium]|nr:transporter substrate-binding domain-containing protein [Chlamydiales bacterium]